jgi:hypothetical protein
VIGKTFQALCDGVDGILGHAQFLSLNLCWQEEHYICAGIIFILFLHNSF